MNAIKNYLDNMFRNLPNTAEVRKAKSELMQMMEDKYEELIADGKSENEAVGIVISEFGNLEEVAESIGLSLEIKNAAPDKPMLTMERVKEYIATVSIRSLMIPLGVALCIMSITGGIASEIVGGSNAVADVLGSCTFFVMIAVAIVLFITSRSKNKAFEDINQNAVSMGIETTDYVVNEKKRYRPTYSMTVGIGIALCICCIVFPIIISAIPFINDDFGALMFFLAVATGVFLIVNSNVRMNGYDRLLKLNGEGKMSEEFIPKEERKISKWPIVLGIITVVVVVGLSVVFGAVRFFSGLFLGGSKVIEHEYALDITDEDSVDNIRVDADACSVIILRDNGVEGIEAEYEGGEALMPEVTFENGELSIVQEVDGNVNANSRHGPEVTVRVGSGIELGDIDLTMDAGNLEFTNITADDISGDLSAVNMELNNCDISSFVITCDAGNIEMENTVFEIIDFDLDFGNIEINGISDLDYYSFDIECEAGMVSFDGHDEGRTYTSSGTGSGEVKILLDAGNIEID